MGELFSGDGYVDSPDKTAKTEGYRRGVAQTGYPLLYALCSDLSQFGKNQPFQVTEAQRSILIVDDDMDPISKAFTRSRIPAMRTALTDSSIPYSEPPYSINKRLLYPPRPGRSAASYTASTHTDLDIFVEGLRQLAEPLGQIPFASSSLTSAVVAQLDPDSKLQFYGGRPLISTLDGIFSTYHEAVLLAQRPILGQEDLPTKDRLLTILNSDVLTDFTRKVHLSTLADLPHLGIVPDNELELRQNGTLALHTDTERFIDIANQHIAIKIDHPMACPFVVPLGNRAEEAIKVTYADRLPPEIANMVRINKGIPGISTAGKAIARYLVDKI
jgi:hypothetical protein